MTLTLLDGQDGKEDTNTNNQCVKKRDFKRGEQRVAMLVVLSRLLICLAISAGPRATLISLQALFLNIGYPICHLSSSIVLPGIKFMHYYCIALNHCFFVRQPIIFLPLRKIKLCIKIRWFFYHIDYKIHPYFRDEI